MRKINLVLNPERAREVAFVLRRELKRGGIFGERELPDDVAKSVLKDLDEETFLLFVTFTTSLDYMRNAKALWESSLKTLKDDEVNWVFSPKEVESRGREELKNALLKHKLALKKEKDTDIWFQVSKTLNREFNGSVRKLFESFSFDVFKMFEKFKKDGKNKFPSISGVKVFPHWIRSLIEKKSLPFKNLEKLPIPVDVHVARATLTTGCITGKYSAKGITETLRSRIIEVWNLALKGTRIIPIEMFRPLWLLSKHGCHYRKNGERPKFSECPVSRFCVDGVVVVSSKKVLIDTETK